MSNDSATQSSQGANSAQTRMQKTNAKEFYCLTEKDVSARCSANLRAVGRIQQMSFEHDVLLQLEPLAFQEKANRRYKNATPTKLYSTHEVRELCVLLFSDLHVF